MEPIDRIRAFFSNDQFAMLTGVEIDEVKAGYSKCSLTIHPKHLNSDGVAMGGALFTLADIAFAAAANVEVNAVTMSSQITFLRPSKGPKLTAEARRVHQGRSTCFYHVDITDGTGTIVAVAMFSGFVKG